MVSCIVAISTWSSLKIQLVSVILCCWIIFRRFLQWMWDPKRFFALETRDSPPACLVDTSLGSHSYVKIKGCKYHYVESGSRGQPVILLLHGFPDCWLSWRYQLSILSVYFHVFALDLKGFGDTDKPQWRSSYRIEKIIGELRQFILVMGISNCTIIGHDLGALLGWYLVYESPELIDKFVAVSCPHPNVYWSNVSSKNNFSRWLCFNQVPYLPELDMLREDIKIIETYHEHLGKQEPKDRYLEAYKYTFSRKEDWSGPINYYRILPYYRLSEGCAPAIVPVLLISGNRDPYIRLESIVKSSDYCDKFMVKVIEGAAHFPHQENPDAFNKHVLGFLKVRDRAIGDRCEGRAQRKGIMDRVYGAVSNTVKYGNSVIDSVQKKTNGHIILQPRSVGQHTP